MIKVLRYTEYIYLVIAVLAAYETFSQWNVARERAYLFLFFTIISVGMFLFRRTYRKRFEKRKQQENQS